MKAIATAPAIKTKRCKIDNRFSSPKRRPIMSDVCNERTPLHASFTPTTPSGIRIRLPWNCAGIPQRVTASLAIAATTRINPCTIGCSIGVTHGTAISVNATGNAKCFSHGAPPIGLLREVMLKEGK